MNWMTWLLIALLLVNAVMLIANYLTMQRLKKIFHWEDE